MNRAIVFRLLLMVAVMSGPKPAFGAAATCDCTWEYQMRGVSKYRQKYGWQGFIQTAPPNIYRTETVTLPWVRRGPYSLDMTEVHLSQVDTEGNGEMHIFGDYSSSGADCRDDCSGSFYDGVWTGDCAYGSCDSFEQNHWHNYYDNAWVAWGTDAMTAAGYAVHLFEETPDDAHYNYRFGWDHAGYAETNESHTVYTDPYPTSLLKSKLSGDWNTGLAALGPNDGWGNGIVSPVVGNYAFDSGTELTASGTVIQWRFKIQTEPKTKYRATWQVMITYDDNSKPPVYGGKMSEILSGTGDVVYTSIKTRKPNMDKDCHVWVVDVGVEVVNDDDIEQGGGPGSGCKGCKQPGIPSKGGTGSNGGRAGSGTPDLAGGPSFASSMGTGLMGDSAGSFLFDPSDGTQNLANPELLSFSNPNGFSDVSYTTNGTLYQVKAPQGLAEVVITSGTKYAVDFYSPADVGGKTNGVYFRSGTPYVSWVFENPDGTNANNHLNILEVRGAGITTNQYTWATNSWEALLGNGLTKKKFTVSYDTNTDTSTEISQVINPTTSAVVSEYTTKHKLLGTQFFLVEEKNGNDPVTTHDYYSGRLTETVYWDGSWRNELYNDYTTGERGLDISGYLNNAPSYADYANRSVEYYYDSYHTNDDLSIHPLTPRLVVNKILGTEVGRRYTMLRTNVVEERMTQFSGADENDAYNLITITTNYGSGTFANWPMTISHPNGTMDVFYYATNSTSFITTVLSGEPNPSGTKTNIVNGTKTITTNGLVGELIGEVQTDLGSGIVLSSVICTNFDAFHRPLRYSYLDGTFEGFGYGCCAVETKTNRDGTITYYSYDALKRLQSISNQGIYLISVYDAADRVLSNIRQGTNGSTITLFSRGYNSAGRTTSETNALGGVTQFSQGFNGSGELLTTNYFIDTTGVKITRTAKDGLTLEISGSAANPTKFLYGIESTGDSSPDGPSSAFYMAEVKLTSTGGTNEWTKTYTDRVGRSYKTVFAAASGTPIRQSFYNAKGQLIKDFDPDSVQRLYQYDSRGRLEYSVLDMDRNGTIDWAGTDQITQTQRDVLYDGTLGANIVRERTFAWETISGNTSNLLSSVTGSTDGLTSWNVTWNGTLSITNSSVVSYPSPGMRRLVTRKPNGATNVKDSIGERVQSVTDNDSGGGQVGKTSYLYDAHGRVQYEGDARNGTTTFTYNNADQVLTRTTPLPGTGQSAQTTTTFYDVLGRDWKVTFADGTSITNEFTVKNERKKISGSRKYPVEYTFDAHGRTETMKTWQNLALDSGKATNFWKFDAYNGLMTNKMYGTSNGPAYTYTPGGRLATRVWARGITTTYTRENSGQVWKVAYSDGVTAGITNTYQRVGRLAAVAHNGTTTTMAYNGAGLLLSESFSGGTLDGLAVTNDYDSYLRSSSSRLAAYSGTINAYTYDTANRLATVGDGTISAAYSYLANSRMVSQILYKQGASVRMITTKQYDLLNRLQSIVSTPNATNTLPIYYGYLYNDANQRTKATQNDGEFWAYQYDSLGQVSSGKKYSSDGVPMEGQQREYVFDDVGNRKSTEEGGNYLGQLLRHADYTNNTLNQITGRRVPSAVDILGNSTTTNTVTVNGNSADYRRGFYFREEMAVTNSATPDWHAVTVSAGTTASGKILIPPLAQTFTYDADGNLTSDKVWTNIWDAENRLISMETLPTFNTNGWKRLTFKYDQKGRRIRKTVAYNWNGTAYTLTNDTRFAYDGWNLIAELNGSTLVRGYIWGNDLSGSLQGVGGVGGLIGINDAVNGGQFFAFDGNGNTAGCVKATDGTVTAYYDYDPFGQTTRATGVYALANTIRFSTKYFDAECDLYYYGHRYYMPSTGRWLNRDPLGELSGNNVYRLLNNQAISFVDILGLNMYPCPLGFKPVVMAQSSFRRSKFDVATTDLIPEVEWPWKVAQTLRELWGRVEQAQGLIGEEVGQTSQRGCVPVSYVSTQTTTWQMGKFDMEKEDENTFSFVLYWTVQTKYAWHCPGFQNVPICLTCNKNDPPSIPPMPL